MGILTWRVFEGKVRDAWIPSTQLEPFSDLEYVIIACIVRGVVRAPPAKIVFRSVKGGYDGLRSVCCQR